jgi:hypothetical protein
MLAHLVDDYDPEAHRRAGEKADELFREIVTPGCQAVTDDLPTARNTLPKDAWLCLFVWCKACHHQGPADLQAIIDAGQGDKPLKDLKFRCAKCGSRMTDHVMMGKGSVGVQPWRTEAG